jgi:cytoskeleton protein RodZ
MRGVSLEEISESTKIGTRSLRALEEEDFEKLPGGIFNKGFVRAYSRFLGLDEEQAVADFDAAWKQHQTANGPPLDLQPEPQNEEPEPSSNRLIGIAVVVLLAIAVGGYALKHYLGERTEASQSFHPESQPAASAPSNTEAPAQSAPANPISERAESAQEKPDLNQSNAEQATTVSAAKNASPTVQNKNAGGANVPSWVASSAPILLQVVAHEDSWLSVSADGKSLGQGILNAQKSRTIRANKEVRLRVGNVAGVEVSFNGKPVNIDGEPKQVKELIFTPEGLQQ